VPPQHKQFIRRTLSMFELAAPEGAEMATAQSQPKESTSEEPAAPKTRLGPRTCFSVMQSGPGAFR
jgi:hypothetical protein